MNEAPEIDWKAELTELHDNLPERLERVALMAEIANHWTDDMRLMPAAGVADILYEALDEIKRHREALKNALTPLRRIAGHDHQGAAISALTNPPNCPFERLQVYDDRLNEVAQTDIQAWAQEAVQCLTGKDGP